jgi:hypothetical protein
MKHVRKHLRIHEIKIEIVQKKLFFSVGENLNVFCFVLERLGVRFEIIRSLFLFSFCYYYTHYTHGMAKHLISV